MVGNTQGTSAGGDAGVENELSMFDRFRRSVTCLFIHLGIGISRGLENFFLCIHCVLYKRPMR